MYENRLLIFIACEITTKPRTGFLWSVANGYFTKIRRWISAMVKIGQNQVPFT
jgi:hypothetical protein